MRVGKEFRWGPACLSKKEIERLVLLGDKVDNIRWRRKENRRNSKISTINYAKVLKSMLILRKPQETTTTYGPGQHRYQTGLRPEQEELKNLYVKLRKGFKEYLNIEETARNNNDIWLGPALISNEFEASMSVSLPRPERRHRCNYEDLLHPVSKCSHCIPQKMANRPSFPRDSPLFPRQENEKQDHDRRKKLAIGARRDNVSRGHAHPMYPMSTKENIPKTARLSLQITCISLLHLVK